MTSCSAKSKFEGRCVAHKFLARAVQTPWRAVCGFLHLLSAAYGRVRFFFRWAPPQLGTLRLIQHRTGRSACDGCAMQYTQNILVGMTRGKTQHCVEKTHGLRVRGHAKPIVDTRLCKGKAMGMRCCAGCTASKQGGRRGQQAGRRGLDVADRGCMCRVERGAALNHMGTHCRQLRSTHSRCSLCACCLPSWGGSDAGTVLKSVTDAQHMMLSLAA